MSPPGHIFQNFDVQSQFDVFRRIPNTLRRMSDRLLDGDSVARQHSTGSLNTSVTTDLALMGELQFITDVLNTVNICLIFKYICYAHMKYRVSYQGFNG